jgi:hypothetical protein
MREHCPVCRSDGRVTRLHKGVCWMHGTLWSQARGEAQPVANTPRKTNQADLSAQDTARVAEILKRAEACELIYLTALAEQVVKEDVPWLAHELARVQAEHQAACESFTASATALQRQVVEARAEVARVTAGRDDLRCYVVHADYCEIRPLGNCTCGLAALLSGDKGDRT